MSDEDLHNIDPADDAQDVVTAADTPQPADPPEPAAPQWAKEDEEEARLFGWKSSSEWQGEKPAGYIDNPGEFLDRVKRSRIFSTMQEKMERQEREAQDMTRRMEAMNKAALDRQKKQFESEMASISQQQRAAVESADTDAWDRLEQRRQALVQEQPREEPQPQQPQQDPFVAQYSATDEGKWVNNPILRQAGAQLIDANPAVRGMPAQQQIEYAAAELRKIYPGAFPQEKKPAATQQPQRQAVDPGGLAGGAGKGSSAFSKLPADAKAQFNRFVADGLFENTKKDQEEYANEYNAA